MPFNLISESLLGKVRCSLLSVFYIHSERRYYMRQLVRLTGLGHGSIQRELAHLVSIGLITKSQNDNQISYHANTDSPIYNDLKNILIKTSGITDLIMSSLLTIDNIDYAFIYGSYAKGDFKADSDIDVMVIGDVEFDLVVNCLIMLQDQINREINPTVFTITELRDRINKNEHFISTVMRSPKIMLLGIEDELRTMAGV